MAETQDPHSATRDSGQKASVHHETSDANIGAVFAFGISLIAGGILISFMTWLLFMFFDRRESAKVTPLYPLAVGQEYRLPPEPRLQATPREDLRALRAHEDVILDHYGWVDRSTGVVRIPISEAMKLTVERGLPARQDTTK